MGTRLSDRNVRAIVKQYKDGSPQRVLAEKYGVVHSVISGIVTGKTYSVVTKIKYKRKYNRPVATPQGIPSRNTMTAPDGVLRTAATKLIAADIRKSVRGIMPLVEAHLVLGNNNRTPEERRTVLLEAIDQEL